MVVDPHHRGEANVYYAEGLKNRIFVIPESSNESYENHMIELRDTYERLRENNRHQTFEFRRGDAVCVFDRKRGFSQRAVIQNVFPNVSRYEVFLVDRGGLREVDGEDILPLKKEFIFPPFGFFVVLPYFKIRDEESQVQITPLRIEDGIIVARIGIDFEKERVPDVYDELLYSTVIDSSSTTLSWSRNSPQHGYLDGGLDNLMSYQNNQRY
ncbi:unnamed protein product [Caenorhabditis auriculariae]|uniref:Tudor domain-containing protein n=1 Tax=Caenorhabditis auriculariae TaxID=2777116 RepID=A0A8S1HPV6_9PELO|nr:unnamed protein product [Caenorhabditis auriculariae]